MKKLLSIIICLAMLFSFVTALPASAQLQQDSDSYYLIGNADDYLEFVDLVNGGQYTANARLTADIDLSGKTVDPIGTHNTDSAKRTHYVGTFDGNGHIVKNLTINKQYSSSANAGFAMFAQLKGATIKDLGIEKATITVTQASNKDGVRLGILACWTEGSTNITNCYVKDSSVTTVGNGYVQAGGTIAACLGANAKISNCYVIDSTIAATEKTSSASGIGHSDFVGYISASTTTPNISNSYTKNVTLTNLTKVHSFARFGTSSSQSPLAGYTKCYGDKTKKTTDIPFTVVSDSGDPSWATLADTLGSAYKNDTLSLNGGAPRLAWEKDPILTKYAINIAESDEGTITSSVTSATPGTEVTLYITPNAGYAIDRVFAELPTDDFSTTELSAPYTFTMPECDVDVMVQFEQVFFGETEGSYCLISTPEDFVEFRNLANSNPKANGKLTADLDMSGYIGQNLSIGNYDSNLDNGDTNIIYSGTFDGNGHVIKNYSTSRNLYDASNRGLALFNRTDSATIKNLGLENAAILNTSPSASGAFIGGIVAYAGGSTVIENCFVKDSTILQNNGVAIDSAGSIVAYMSAGSVVRNTYARGNKIGNAVPYTATSAGGNGVATFVGRTSPSCTKDSIVNCYSKDNQLVNLGDTKMAGFARVGYSGDTDVAFTGCYTDYLAGFDSGSSMNKLASDSEDWKTLASSLGSAYRNDNEKFPQNGGAPRLVWEKIPDYEILGVTDNGTLTVDAIENNAVEGAKIFIASYDRFGKMLAVDSIEFSDLSGSFNSTVSVAGASKIKAIIWDGTLNPLSFNYTGKVIKGQLYDVNDLPYTIEDGVMTVESLDAENDYASFEDAMWSEEEGITKIVIGPRITKIGANAFAGFDGITAVEIPENVTEIADNAFADVNFTVCGYASSAAEAFATKHSKEFFLKKLRILTIGNSHTSDHGQWNKIILGDLYDAGIETEIAYTRLTNGGFTMYRNRGKTDDGYPKSHYANGTDPNANLYSKYATLLDNYNWDLVLIQDYRESGEDADVVPDFAEGMAKTVKWLRSKQPGAKIGWIVDWVDKNYDVSSVAELSDLYNRNTVRNINAVLNMESDAPDYIIPMGTALINARTSYLSNVNNAADCYTNDSNSDWIGSEKIVNYNLLERDGTHVSYELGRYITGASVFGYIYELYQDQLLGGEDVNFCDALKTGPVTTGRETWKGEFTDSIWNITKETVRNTVNNPYQITASRYTVDPADAMADTVENASYPTFTKAGIVNTIKSLGSGFTVTEDDVTISGNTATVRFLYGYTEKTVTITK